MKLGKESLIAIIESALFVLGAFFFLLVIIIPTNPIWALITGISLGLAGAIVWLYPYIVRLVKNIHTNLHQRIERLKGPQINAEDVADKILKSERTKRKNYELHRADSYDNITDEIIANDTSSQAPTSSRSKSKKSN